MKIQTINQLISVWRDIATRHYQINGFGIGDSWEVGTEGAYMHPVLWINPVTANMPSSENGYKTFEIDFEVRIFDLVNKDESNENHVLSDTIDILKDIIAEFKGHPYYVNSQLNIIGDIDFEAFTEEFDEEVSGWLCEISLMTPVLTTFCGIPSADITGFEFPGIDCPEFNVLCPVFVEDVTGVYPIVVTTIGTTKEISIDGALGANTYVESGTYSAGTLTLVRNDAVEINVTGFTDENDFTNGVTLDGNVLKFDRTDLVNAYSIDLTPILSGEVNTSSNSGTGEGLALSKVGSDLPFKTIKAGANITLNSTATEIEIVGAGGVDTNIGNTDLTQTDQFRKYILAGVNPSYLEFQASSGSDAIRLTDQLQFLMQTNTSDPVTTYSTKIDGSGIKFNDGNWEIRHQGVSQFYIQGITPYNGKLGLNTGAYLQAPNANRAVELGGHFIKFKDRTLGVEHARFDQNGNFMFNATALIGSEGFLIADDMLVKGSDTSAGTTGFKVTNSANTSLLEVRNNGDLYTEGLQGLSETVTFGGGSTGDIASLTYTNGIVTGKTLVP